MRGFLLPTIILAVFGGLFGVTEATDAQDLDLTEVIVSLELEQVSLKKALDEIEEQTAFTFAFSYNAIDPDRSVSIKVHDKSVDQILKQLFRARWVSWALSGKTILLKKWPGLEQNSSDIAFDGTITGQVVRAETGETLPGVNIKLKGTTTGTNTDQNGEYELVVPSLQDTLIFSFIGLKTETVPINGREIINISLETKALEGEEMVVVAYGMQEKATVTGAVFEAPMDEISAPPTMSISNTLGGRVPGITSRQSSGEPGRDGSRFLIRGVGTFANSSPLILVDGVERTIDNINPEQIESMTILKDASATAVYGADGANGVILVETKRGQQGQTHISFKSEVGMLKPIRRPDLIGGSEWVRLVNESNRVMGTPETYSQEQIEKFDSGSDPYLYPNIDWMDMVLKDQTYQTRHNLSISGGGDIVQFYVNGNVAFKNGIYKSQVESDIYQTDLKDNLASNALARRYNLRSNIDIKASENLTFHASLGGSLDENKYPGIGGDTGSGDIFYSMLFASPTIFPPFNPDGSLTATSGWRGGWNPVEKAMYGGYITRNHNRLQTTFSADWDLSDLVTQGLAVKALFAADQYHHHRIRRRKTYEKKQYLGKDSNGEDQYNIIQNEGGHAYWRAGDSNKSTDLHLQLNYESNIGQRHDLSALLLLKRREFIHSDAGSAINNLPHRDQGLSGRIQYGYDDRYLLEINAGYTGSENFPAGDRYGLFPSISAGWRISNENFWNIDFINSLKLRASYGEIGNSDIGGRRFLYFTRYNESGSGYLFGDDQRHIGGTNIDLLGNPDLTWEVSTKTNLGLDFELFDGIVSLTANVFNERRENILLQRNTIPYMLGFTGGATPYGNVGIVDNKGIDGVLKVSNTTSGGLFYRFRGTFTFARSNVVDNDHPPREYEYQSRVGHPLGQPFGLVSLGYFKDQDDIDNHPNQTFQSDIKPGDVKYKDVNEDGVIDQYDEVAIGYPNAVPEVMGGFGATFAYKGWETSVFIRAVTNTSSFVGGGAIEPFTSGANTLGILKEYYDNRWTEDNKEGAKYPVARYGDAPNNYRNSTNTMRDGSFIRLKNARIAYNLPSGLLRKANIRNVQVYLEGQNLLTLDRIGWTNPDASLSSPGTYPIHMSFTLGTEINF